jgi:hypothetical protein
MVPSGTGALVSWFTASGASTASWETRAINLDGTPRSAIVPHLSFPTMGGVYVDVMSLAVTPQCAFGGLVDDVAAGCRFLPLDGDGNEIGPVASLPGAPDAGCGALGPAPQGFSFLQESSTNGMIELVAVGTDGSLRFRAPLGAWPGPGTRLVLGDETFLLSTFFENDAGGDLTEEVAHYDARGEQMTPGTTVTTDSGSILLMAETSGGVLASYLGFDPANESGQAMYVVPLSRDGMLLGTTPHALDVTGADGPLYGFSLDPSPSGEAVLTWNELDEATDHYRFFMMELDASGQARGAPTALGTYEGVGDVHVLVGADGDHALLVYSGAPNGGQGGVHTLPLMCAAH